MTDLVAFIKTKAKEYIKAFAREINSTYQPSNREEFRQAFNKESEHRAFPFRYELQYLPSFYHLGKKAGDVELTITHRETDEYLYSELDDSEAFDGSTDRYPLLPITEHFIDELFVDLVQSIVEEFHL